MQCGNLSSKSQYNIYFYIYKGIKDSISNAIVNKDKSKIQQLEEEVNWYSKEIIMSANDLAQELNILRNI